MAENLEYKVIYPWGGKNQSEEPIHILVKLPVARGLIIQGISDGDTGLMLFLFDDKGQEMGCVGMGGNYDYYEKMSEYIAENMNTLFELEEKVFRIEQEQLDSVMKEVLKKCQSVKGNRIPNTEYEALIVFE